MINSTWLALSPEFKYLLETHISLIANKLPDLNTVRLTACNLADH